jgi:hypothetical protein
VTRAEVDAAIRAAIGSVLGDANVPVDDMERAIWNAALDAAAKVVLNQGLRGNYHDEALRSRCAEAILLMKA